MTAIVVSTLPAHEIPRQVPDLNRILIDSVSAGAAISFLDPLSQDEATAFWRDAVSPEVAKARRVLFVAKAAGRVTGTVQLLTALPPNQPHRCEIAKMVVHPDARRQGLGRALVNTAIDTARSLGKTLITLDTRTGDAAQSLYAAAGFETAGRIPRFALDPDGRTLHATTYMYLRL